MLPALTTVVQVQGWGKAQTEPELETVRERIMPMLYPEDVWQKYMTVTMGRQRWDEILTEYHVDYLILDTDYHVQTGLFQRVSDSPRCAGCYERKTQGTKLIHTEALSPASN